MQIVYSLAQGRLRLARALSKLPLIGSLSNVVNRCFWGFVDFISGAPSHAPPPVPLEDDEGLDDVEDDYRLSKDRAIQISLGCDYLAATDYLISIGYTSEELSPYDPSEILEIFREETLDYY